MLAPFDSSHTSSYSRFTVTVALSCIISEIKRNTGRKSRFFHTPPAIDAPVRGPSRNIATTFGVEKQEWCGYHCRW